MKERTIGADDAPPRALSAKHRVFVDSYLASGNAAGAAKLAGFSPRRAQSLLANQAIAEAIAARQQAAQEAQPAAVVSGATPAQQELIDRADAAFREAQATSNITGMIGATRLKGELLGLMEPPAPIEGKVDVGPTDPRELCKVFMRLMADEDMLGEWREMVRNIVLTAHRQLSDEARDTPDHAAYERFTGHQVADAILPASEAAP